MTTITESTTEEAALNWFSSLGYETIFGPDISLDGDAPERKNYQQVILFDRLKAALAKINPDISTEIIDQVAKKLAITETPNLYENNYRFHKKLIEGISVEYQEADGRISYKTVNLIDFDNPENNDWLAVNQFTVVEKENRRPDIVVFINGLPIGVIELKNASDEDATMSGAFNQIQTYKNDIPSLFAFNEVAVISDGFEANTGTLTSNWEWFLPWRTVDGIQLDPKGSPGLETLIKGIFNKNYLLDLIKHFIVYDTSGGEIVKKVAGYHQFYAVNKALEKTGEAAGGNKKVGVVWHTQGSGKSLTMAFYAGKAIQQQALKNPTIVVLTDRNDLDDQLFNTFSACHDLLRQEPAQSQSREDLKKLLSVASGGVIFTTIQKFFPDNPSEAVKPVSERKNIIVIADEAHRSQYEFIKGFARHMRDTLPNASFIGFTATPIEFSDKSTPAVFGDYIDVYDIEQAVADGATVPIYYEARLAKLKLDENEKPHIDPEFEEVTENEEVSKKDKLKRKWAQLEAIVGSKKRVKLIAKDIVNHFEQREETLEGKAMVVCMSRRICIDLYNEIIKLRPDWHSDDDNKGLIKVVMTGSATDPVEWQKHIRNKKRRKEMANNFKKPDFPVKLVLVRDMWLTGFDAPPLHTIYVDKPMKGHGLMQAIARVNRVFRNKPGGLVVDYLGLAANLKQALADYAERDKEYTGIPQEQAVSIMLEKFEIAALLLHGFDYTSYYSAAPEQKLSIIQQAMEYILAQEDGKERFSQAVSDLSKAFALAVPHEKAKEIRDEVGFFQVIKAQLNKNTLSQTKSIEEIDTAIRQIVSKAVVPDKVVDIFSAAGIKSPDISILSDEFLEDVRRIPQKNLALEMLRKLLNDELKIRKKKNLVQARSFAEMLYESIKKYQNRTLEAAEVINELIELAKDIREADKRGEDLGLTEEELAFYDALETNDSAVKVLGDETLRIIAVELVNVVWKNITIDWSVRENARAKLRVGVKRILRKYGYPPDKQAKATQTVLEQAQLFSNGLQTTKF